MRTNSIRAWRAKDSPTWSALRRLQEMLRYFRLGSLITKLHEQDGICRWTMCLSDGPVNIKGEASGRICGLVKEQAAVDLMDQLKVEFGFYSESPQPMETEQDLSAVRIERLTLDRPVEVACAVCGDFVEEAEFPNHTNRCYRVRLESLSAELRSTTEELTNVREEVDQSRRAAFRCLVCMEDAAELRDANWLGALQFGHIVYIYCFGRLRKGPASHRRECPTCRRSLRAKPMKLFN